MSLIKGVIFDMDGCLIDSEIVHMENWRYAFRDQHYDITEEQVSHWTGMAKESIDREVDLITGDPEVTQRLRRIREERFFEMLAAGDVHMKPYALEALTMARELGLTVSLGTSTGKEKALVILKALDLEQYFDYMTFGSEVEHGKPAPDIFLLAAKRMGLSTSEVMLFEDSKNGVTAGVSAGIPYIVHIPDSSVHYNQGEYGAWRQVPDFKEGIRLMQQLAAGNQ